MTSADATSSAPIAGSQTLSRGLRALDILAEAESPLTIAELAESLGVHRSVAYRIVRTLEEHRLVTRDEMGVLSLGVQLAVLARSVSRDVQSAALPVLGDLAAELGLTAFVAVLDGGDVVTLTSVEPSHTVVSVAQRPGTRHSVAFGATGQAIRASLTAAERRALPEGAPSAAIVLENGYAVSDSEVVPGLQGIAVPLRLPGLAPAALAVVYVGDPVDEPGIAARLDAATGQIRAGLG